MKHPSWVWRFLIVGLVFTVFLVACERPAPTGEVPDAADPVEQPDTSIEVPTSTPASQPIEDPPLDSATDEVAPESAEQPAEEAVEGEGTQTEGESTEATDAAGDTSAEQPAEEPEPLPPDGVYVVESGDSLFAIALRYGVSVDDIAAANDIEDVDSLEVGQQLVIPEPGFADTVADDGPTGETVERIHIVQSGDTLYRIGVRYGFSVDELARYNEITDVNNLTVGQEIRIPPPNE